MKPNDPLAKLLRAAARAERAHAAESLDLPFGWQTRVLAAARKPEDIFAFLPLFRGAAACAATIAVICAAVHFTHAQNSNPYETLNYSLASAYLE